MSKSEIKDKKIAELLDYIEVKISEKGSRHLDKWRLLRDDFESELALINNDFFEEPRSGILKKICSILFAMFVFAITIGLSTVIFIVSQLCKDVLEIFML